MNVMLPVSFNRLSMNVMLPVSFLPAAPSKFIFSSYKVTATGMIELDASRKDTAYILVIVCSSLSMANMSVAFDNGYIVSN
jgi:hypothetical protein